MTFPRVRALIFVAVLFVTAGVVVLTAINKDTQTLPPAQSCEPGRIRVNVEVVRTDQVTLNVLNGSQRIGLADQIARELSHRGFNIATVGTVPPGQEFDGVGHITFGPEAVSAGWLVQAFFLKDELAETFVPEREGQAVDLVLGDAFQQLATTTEVNQRIAALGEPEAPPGTCPGLVVIHSGPSPSGTGPGPTTSQPA
jgi:hypothetical protein